MANLRLITKEEALDALKKVEVGNGFTKELSKICEDFINTSHKISFFRRNYSKEQWKHTLQTLESYCYLEDSSFRFFKQGSNWVLCRMSGIPHVYSEKYVWNEKEETISGELNCPPDMKEAVLNAILC